MESDILHNALIELGLDDLAANIYIAFLNLKNPTISEVAKKLSVERLTIYRGLERLENAGLVNQKTKNDRHVNLEPPSIVISLLRHKQSVAKNLSQRLSTLLPDLLANYHQNLRQPKVRVYEDKESFMTLLDESVTEADEELYFLGSPNVLNFVPDYMQVYIKNRVKKGIISKSISFQNPSLALRGHKEELRELKWLPPEYDVPAAFLAYGNKLAIWNTALPKIIVIEDKIIFDLFKAIFEILWSNLR